MTSWHSYPKVYNLGHRVLASLFDGEVVAQEKIDGSQFSFGIIDGKLRFRSKGQEIYPESVDTMFRAAIASVQERESELRPGWTYRGEYLSKPKHNVLAYDRVPCGNIILFDVNTEEENYLSPTEVAYAAWDIGLEAVPELVPIQGWSPEAIAGQMDTVSVLGGQKIEGIVFKNYAQFGPDKKALMGKHVSEAFKEVHAGEWKKANPSGGDIVQGLIAQYRTPARWQKAVQHLAERGELKGEPADIGPLMKEVALDLRSEEADAIRESLFTHAWPRIQRGVVAGLPEWYKQMLIELQDYNAEE